MTMTNRMRIMCILKKNTVATSSELSEELGWDKNKTRDTLHDLKTAGLVKSELDDVTENAMYRLTPKGLAKASAEIADVPKKETPAIEKSDDADAEAFVFSKNYGHPVDKSCCNAAKVMATTAGSELKALEDAIAEKESIIDNMRRELQASEDSRILAERQRDAGREVGELLGAMTPDETRTCLNAMFARLESTQGKLQEWTAVAGSYRCGTPSEINARLTCLLAQLAKNTPEITLTADDTEAEEINHPTHYQGNVECIDAIESALGREGFAAFCRGNVMKYTFRAGKKGPAKVDLSKAAWYLSKINGESQ